MKEPTKSVSSVTTAGAVTFNGCFKGSGFAGLSSPVFGVRWFEFVFSPLDSWPNTSEIFFIAGLR